MDLLRGQVLHWKKHEGLRGFSLVELLVVIAVISIISVIGLAVYSNISANARDTRRSTDGETIYKSLAIYHSTHGNYPIITSWVSIEADADANGPFFQEMKNFFSPMPRDPNYGTSTFSYQYKSTDDGQGYKVYIQTERSTPKIVTGGNGNTIADPGSTPTPTSLPAATNTPVPTSIPLPTSTPTNAPTLAPTSTPTSAPTNIPTLAPTSAPTPTPTQTTITFRVTSVSDDGADIVGDTVFHSAGNPGSGWSGASNLAIGGKNGSGSKITSGLRFTNVTVPQGATIVSAFFDLQNAWPGGNYGSNVKLIVKGAKVASLATFSSSNLPRNIAQTTASVNWNSASEVIAAGVWFSNTASNKPPAITSVIQEIVNQAGWVSGNSIGILLIDDLSGNDWWYEAATYESGPTNAAKLTITYR